MEAQLLNVIWKTREAVGEAVLVFILFHSKGYVTSQNCREEIYAAAALVIYERNTKSVLESMKKESSHFGKEMLMSYDIYQQDDSRSFLAWVN